MYSKDALTLHQTGEHIRQLRQQFGLTQTELGGAHYSKSYVSVVEEHALFNESTCRLSGNRRSCGRACQNGRYCRLRRALFNHCESILSARSGAGPARCGGERMRSGLCCPELPPVYEYVADSHNAEFASGRGICTSVVADPQRAGSYLLR